ncbi:hypothetical protein Efla_006364 [Eimeria flavescens]
MEGSGNAGQTPFIVVEGHNDLTPVGGGGDRKMSEDIPLFHGIEIPETEGSNRMGKDYEGAGEVSGPKEDLQLHTDQQADNPFNDAPDSQQVVSNHPEGEHADETYGEFSGPAAYPGRADQEEPPANPPSQQPLPRPRGDDRLPRPQRLRRAGSSMKDGFKSASARVAHAGEQMGRAWNKTLDSAMIVCVICGALAILLIAIALSMHSWRYQSLLYADDNGVNISRVDLGLRKLQRIQSLERNEDAGLILMYDRPFAYEQVMRSAYCVRGEEPAEAAPASGGPPPADSGEAPSAAAPPTRLLQITAKSPKRKGPLANPPPYSVTVGRNPEAPGSLQPQYVEMREVLLGSTVFDVHCKDLVRFKDSGALFLRMMIAYFVAAGLGMLGAICALLLAPMTGPWCTYMKRMPINLLGTLAWIVALVVELSALAAWGVGTDVAACVTFEGGASVCRLGSGVGLTVASLVLTLVATLSYCVFFTHTFIKDLGLEKEKEQKLRQLSERRKHSSELIPSVAPDRQPSSYRGDDVQAANTRERVLSPAEAMGAPGYPQEGLLEGPREDLQEGGPHQRPALGESNSPVRPAAQGLLKARSRGCVCLPSAWLACVLSRGEAETALLWAFLADYT